MPVFTIETPSGRRIKIEATDEATAIRGAQEYESANSGSHLSGDDRSSPIPGDVLEKGNAIVDAATSKEPESDRSKKLRAELSGITKGFGKDKGNGALRAADSFVRGAADMATFGLSDEISAGLSAATGVGGDFGEYERNLDRERIQQQIRDEQDPVASTVGRVAGGVATGVGLAKAGLSMAGRLAPRAGLGAKVAAGAADGAAQGGAYGFGSGEDGVVERLENAAGNAALGLGVGAAAPAVGTGLKAGYRAVADRVGSAVRSMVSPAAEASRRVGHAMGIDMATPGAVMPADELAAAARSGQPVLNADRGGETTRALARVAANSSPAARGQMERAVSDRFADQGNRVVRLISRLTGGRTDDLLLLDGIKDAASAANKDAYKKAYGTAAAQDMWDSRFAQLMQAPVVQNAVKAAEGRGANRAAAAGFQAVKNPFVEQNGKFMLRVNRDGSVAKPTLQFWDQVKRNLDSEIGTAQRSGDNAHAADVIALKKQLVDALDTSVPEYKAARQGAAAFFGAEDAVDAGKAFAKSTRMLPEYKRGILAMKPAEKEAFETGFASELIDQAKSAGDRTNVITRMFKSPEQREKMVQAFGPERAREIEMFVKVEGRMDAFRNAFGNSTTARQLAEMGVVGGGAWLWTGDWKSGVTAAAITQGARAAGKKIDGNVMTKMAEMLLSDDPKLIAKAVQQASLSQQHAGALDAITMMASNAVRSAAMPMLQDRR